MTARPSTRRRSLRPASQSPARDRQLQVAGARLIDQGLGDDVLGGLIKRRGEAEHFVAAVPAATLSTRFGRGRLSVFPSCRSPATRTPASASSALPPLIRMPCLAARESPDTMATGTARISGHGVATTSTATARTGSPAKQPCTPASTTVTTEEQQREAVGQPRHWRLRALRLLDQANDAGIGALGGVTRRDADRTPRPHWSTRSSPRRRRAAAPVAIHPLVRIDQAPPTPPATAPSTGTTSPCRMSSRSPGSTASRPTSSSPPLRWRTAVRGTRARSAVISRRA